MLPSPEKGIFFQRLHLMHPVADPGHEASVLGLQIYQVRFLPPFPSSPPPSTFPSSPPFLLLCIFGQQPLPKCSSWGRQGLLTSNCLHPSLDDPPLYLTVLYTSVPHIASKVFSPPSYISIHVCFPYKLGADHSPAFISHLFQPFDSILQNMTISLPDTWPPPLECCCSALPASPKSGSPLSPRVFRFLGICGVLGFEERMDDVTQVRSSSARLSTSRRSLAPVVAYK